LGKGDEVGYEGHLVQRLIYKNQLSWKNLPFLVSIGDYWACGVVLTCVAQGLGAGQGRKLSLYSLAFLMFPLAPLTPAN
jgi:hypothetical protein